MKKYLLLLALSTMVLGGCGAQTTSNKNVSVTGDIMTKVGDDFVLNNKGETTTLSSTKINLDQYMGKKVEVKGQYSGTTLYVDEIKEETLP